MQKAWASNGGDRRAQRTRGSRLKEFLSPSSPPKGRLAAPDWPSFLAGADTETTCFSSGTARAVTLRRKRQVRTLGRAVFASPTPVGTEAVRDLSTVRHTR